MKKEGGSRRSFLQSILAGSTVAAVAVAGGGKPARAGNGTSNTDATIRAMKDEILYHETDAFKRYYETLKS